MQYPGVLMKRLFTGILLLFMLSVCDLPCRCAELISPAQGEHVTISNDMTQDWWDHYKKNDGVKLADKKEHCKPKPIVFKWETPEEAGEGYSYELSISTSPDFGTPLLYHTDKKYYRVYNLCSCKKYYWRVKTSGPGGESVSPVSYFYTKRGPRFIRVNGAYNVRDIGGIRTSSGKFIKQGLAYRAGNFDKIKEKGKKRIQELGIRTQLDVRKDGEGKVGQKTLPVENFVHIRGHSYYRIWKTKKRIKRTINIMKLFADQNNYPIAYHCVYGRDRTGTITILIYGLLGVEKEAIYRDYELTFLSRHSGSHGKKKMKLLDEFYEQISIYKDPTKSLRYNVRAFLIDNGMTTEELQNIERILLSERR